MYLSFLTTDCLVVVQGSNPGCLVVVQGSIPGCLVVIQSSIPGRERPKSLKLVKTTTLPNARQEMRVSQVLGDNQYKGFNHVIVGVARVRMPSIGQNL